MLTLRLVVIFASVVLVQAAAARSPAPAVGEDDWAARAFGGTVLSPTVDPVLTIYDLVRLRDLEALSLSPDGKFLVFSVRQGEPTADRYAVRWFILPTNGSAEPRAMDFDGGQPIPAYAYGLPQAAILAETPQWSPDGKRIAVRRMIEDRIELWVLNVTTGRANQVSDGAAEVTEFRWLDDKRLVYRTGFNPAKFESAVEQEAGHGWLWDGRIPIHAAHMRPTRPDCTIAAADPSCEEINTVYEDGKAQRSATGSETAILPGSSTNTTGAGPGTTADVRLEVADPKFTSAPVPMRQVVAQTATTIRCTDRACFGPRIRTAGWLRLGQTVWFLKAESPDGRLDAAGGDISALYEWHLRTRRVRPIYKVAGVLADCALRLGVAYCTEETATQPRRIVAINLSTGTKRILADPNPSFKAKTLPKVRSFTVSDNEGEPHLVQVVFPLNYKEGTRYPLVVTQYSSYGFLRGQVGDEYPILPLASAGFAVVSINWSRPTKMFAESSIEEINAWYAHSGRQQIRELINSTVDQLIAQRLADPQRIALTGLSSGSEVVNYMLQRDTRYAAAIASSGSQDLTFFALVPSGPNRTRLMREFGAESLIPNGANPIADMAWSNKPNGLSTPFLINVGEWESMIGFEGLQAVKEAGGPLELRIFPREAHIKYHPRTFLGIYENNLEWLEFWLMGRRDGRTELRAQYDRWGKMAAKLGREVP